MTALAGRALFAAVAPRLERAHRIRREQERRERLKVRTLVLRAERRVAHRELQLARSTGRSGDYYVERRRKLTEARAELEHLQRWAKRIRA